MPSKSDTSHSIVSILEPANHIDTFSKVRFRGLVTNPGREATVSAFAVNAELSEGDPDAAPWVIATEVPVQMMNEAGEYGYWEFVPRVNGAVYDFPPNKTYRVTVTAQVPNLVVGGGSHEHDPESTVWFTVLPRGDQSVEEE